MGKLAVLLVAGLLMGVAGRAVAAPPSLPPFDRTMTLERVEPHVVRVLDDGAGHDLTDPNTFEDLKPVSLLAAGDDGSVWMTSSRGFIKIGSRGEVRDPFDTFLAQMEIGLDGALWIADAYQGTTRAHRASRAGRQVARGRVDDLPVAVGRVGRVARREGGWQSRLRVA